MQQVLVYADSLTWGIIPDTRRRLAFDERWPGVMEHALVARGRRVRVIEDCLNGRRTAFDDPYKPGRNALSGIEQAIEAHSPLALVILMLGTNDFQSMHPHTAWHSAQGLAALIDAIRRAPIEPGMPVPGILVLAPPRIEQPRGAIAAKFVGADEKSVGLSEAFLQVAAARSCAFLDAATVTPASRIDGVHLDADQHARLGRAVAERVHALLEAGAP
jgi:lysophospholipase L1-like esterase